MTIAGHQSANGEHHPRGPWLSGLRVVMLGRQGSGKGTQGVQFARLLVVPHISVGDVLREAASSESPVGRRAQEMMERGELVADDLVVSLVAERLAAPDVRSGGFVLDGFPRTVDQAAALDGILADSALDRAVVIDVPLEVARARLLARRVCTGCGRIYSVERARGLETWTCGACGGEVHRRADDTEEAVTRRLTLYDEQTQPLLDWFTCRDQLLVVDGVGTSEEVFSRLLAGLWPRIPVDRIAQLAGVSEPVPTGPVLANAEDLSATAVEVVIEVPRAAGTSTSSTTTATYCTWTGGCSPPPSTRPTTDSSPTRSPRTVTRSTPWCCWRSRSSPGAGSASGQSASSGWKTRRARTPRSSAFRWAIPAGIRSGTSMTCRPTCAARSTISSMSTRPWSRASSPPLPGSRAGRQRWARSPPPGRACCISSGSTDPRASRSRRSQPRCSPGL